MRIDELQDRGMSTEEIEDLMYEDKLKAVREMQIDKKKIYDNEENGRDEKHDRI